LKEESVKIPSHLTPHGPLSVDEKIGSCTTEKEADVTAWFAIQTLYKYEFRVLRDLTAKGFTGYLPLLRETRQWTDRKKTIETPAFGGYLFLRHDSSLQSRSLVLNTSGVFRMLPDNHKPSAIADIEIESLRRALDSNMPCIRCELPPVGSRVRVKSGVLAGVEGQIVRIQNKSRLVILVSSIAQGISVEVDGMDVETIADISPQHSLPHAQAWRQEQSGQSAT
jgi:transcriptional antiterminator RfaH